jgi:carboxypeptidase family protein
MMTVSGCRLAFFITLFCAVASVVPVVGQGADATIFGQVTDESGALLPGVTVTVTSPALQVQQMVAVTDERGQYRVTPLPIGTYTVEYMLQGFQAQRREGIRLTSGFVARLDVSLAVGGVQETVTVTGASPVVDVKTTAAGTEVTTEIIETIPTSRNSFNSLLTLAAGARPEPDTGNNMSSDVVFSAFGRFGDAWVTTDGLPMSPPENDGNPGFQTAFNYNAVDEANVQTLGTSAEAVTSGIQLNVITKSGSNVFHGSAFGAYTPDWLETEDNLDDGLRAQGLTAGDRFSHRWDSSGDIGGKVIQDKLWFWTGVRRRKQGEVIPGAFNADGTPSEFAHDQRFFSAKVTGQVTTSQQAIGSVHVRTHPRTSGPSSRFAAPDQLRATNFRTVPQWQGTWQWVKGNRVLSVQGGDHRVRIPVPPVLTQNAAWRDDVTGYQGGLEPRAGRRIVLDRWSGRASLNWYKMDWGGDHDFRTGALYSRTNRWEILVDNGLPMGNYTLRYRSGVPDNIRVGNNPIDPQSYLGYLGAFVQDSWSVNRRLTFNLGVRYANDRAWLPGQCRAAAPREFAVVFPAECWPEKDLKTWNPVMPRLHFAYDLTGDARTVIKGGWGRFNLLHDRIELDIANPNARKEARFRWRDLNNNRYFDAGESNLDPNGPDFQGISIPGAAYVVEGPGGTTNVSTVGLVDNPDLKQQGSDEFSLSFERELFADFGVRVTGLYVREFNTQRIENPLRPYGVYTIPITNSDPGDDNLLRTADDPGRTITYYDYPASLRGAAFEGARFINDSSSDADYRSFEVAVNKRYSNRWQMLASYTATKKNIFVPRNSAYNPNSEINAADKTWEWLFRGTGSYLFPYDIQLSSNLLVQSGFAWARTVSMTGGAQIPSIVLFAEETGARHTPTQTTVALGVEKRINLRGGHRVAVALQFLNVLNGNFDIELPQTRGGPELGYAINTVPPRVGEITIRYSF